MGGSPFIGIEVIVLRYWLFWHFPRPEKLHGQKKSSTVATGIPHRTLSKVMLTMTTLTAVNISPQHLNNITNTVKAFTPIQELTA